jgi:hypothetical protein
VFTAIPRLSRAAIADEMCEEHRRRVFAASGGGFILLTDG